METQIIILAVLIGFIISYRLMVGPRRCRHRRR